MLLPLGDSRSGQALQADGSVSGPQDGTHAGAAAASGSRPPPRGASPSRRVSQRRDATQGPGGTTAPGQRVLSVCWICLAVGHECRAYPDARGRTFTAASRAEADRIRAGLRAQMRATLATSAAVGTPTPPGSGGPPPGGPPSADGRASAHL